MESVTREHQARIESETRLLQKVQALSLPGNPPYFAHLRLKTANANRPTDILLGNVNHVGSEVSLIDWQSAPLAEVFFNYDEGEEYELDLVDRTVRGTVVEKNLLTFENRNLVQIETGGIQLSRNPRGQWLSFENSSAPQLLPRAPAARRPFRSPLEVDLDPAQQSVVDLHPHRSVLVLGEAGFGKTTVALHRLVALQQRKGRLFLAIVIVPTEGLKRLTELMLERRKVSGVEVETYDAWASRMARKVFRDLPRRESLNPNASIIKLKRHRILRPVLQQFVEERPRPTTDEERPTHSKALARRADLEHLFGDRSRMSRVVAEAGGTLGPGVVAQIAEHTRVQFCDSAEASYRHLDKESLITLDGKGLDEGTPMEDADTVDAEDYAVLFEIDRLRSLARRQKPAPIPMYHCIVLDEAQEFASLELSMIGRALGPNGTVIVAGDAAQQVDPSSDFGGWSEVMSDLRLPQFEPVTLKINYRCPPAVTNLARALLEGAKPSAIPDPSIIWMRHDNSFHRAVWLNREVAALEAADPSSSIAVVCRSALGARAMHRALDHGLTVRLALNGNFEFKAGIVVTCVEEVKGLEFDHVIVPDADSKTYPDTAESRRALYVAVTRATHRLVLSAAGAWSSIFKNGTPPLPLPICL